jgi:uncharacterized protein involved in outer membrane biogenesis
LSETTIRGDLTSERQPDKRPAVTLRLESPRLHLPDLVAARRAVEGAPGDRGANGFDLAGWWRGRDALPVDALHAFDAELSLEAERISGAAHLEAKELRIAGRLDDGLLRFEEIQADYEKGKVSGRFELDVRPISPVASLELEAFNVDLTGLMSQFQAQTEYAGLLDLSIRLDTTGDTAPEVRENLHGFFGAMLREGAIVNEYSKALTYDILRVSIPSFGATPGTDAPVQCLLALVPVDDGVAELETFYVEGEKITIVGEGSVDLKAETLDLRFTPRVHEPGLVSIAATVEVSGPIADPGVSPIRQSMVTSALLAVYRNVLRPAKALDRILRRRDSKGGGEANSPCGRVARQRVTQMLTGEVEAIDLESTLESGEAADAAPPVEVEAR